MNLAVGYRNSPYFYSSSTKVDTITDSQEISDRFCSFGIISWQSWLVLNPGNTKESWEAETVSLLFKCLKRFYEGWCFAFNVQNVHKNNLMNSKYFIKSLNRYLQSDVEYVYRIIILLSYYICFWHLICIK